MTKFEKKQKRLGRLMDKTMERYQALGAMLDECGIFETETGQALLDRWANRLSQLNEWELRKIHRRFFNKNC